ncbi:glycosyltransferase [Streptococcus suis]|uniref:glycosyltransferase n=1 Tax=Streptococcus suis TaxID=1307 RepID=UPI0005BC1AB4|nr:glycosyltransferase [Streptococcus suis]MCH1636171.1 glycosyltransferase [Streptococcus suis]MCL4910763.1 glycosyltransferase [Streptococcus suis]MCL4947577.1 glycosyltransferase [Streptococcus suis]MCL4948827.1 glycosyltransferase [Streptococcus suis]MCL4957490.1 glycosyltransferase [Streptococcus suis]
MYLMKIIFWLSIFLIFWANIGYPASMIFLDKIIKKTNEKLTDYEPTVTVMVVAHNEEGVIADKLMNLLQLDYPKDKFNILVTSDNSTDRTNEIVNEFVLKYQQIYLYQVEKRQGKTNAQNEASKLVKSEILVMTDANAMLKHDAINELVSSFTNNVAYVTGKLDYINQNESLTSKSESTYWDLDTRIRDIESRFQTITAGNGAIYAVRTEDYVDFDPIMSHDSAMPLYFNLLGKRAVANHKAIAYEKAGENDGDEFKRKIRMARITLHFILPSIKILNVFKYKWFTYFYLGHRTVRYLLWFNHIILFIASVVLMSENSHYWLPCVGQLIIYLIASMKYLFSIDIKIINFIAYYCMTVTAQLIGVLKTILGRNKPFWEKAESTR